MKKTLLFIALVVGATNLTYAQQANKGTAANVQAQAATITPEQRIEKKVQRLTSGLNLTAQQQTSIRQILTEGNNALEPLRKAKDANKLAIQKKAIQQQVEAVLTADQKAKLHQIIKDQSTRSRDNNANAINRAN